MLLKFCSTDDLEEGYAVTKRIMAKNIAVYRLNGELHAIEADCKHQKRLISRGKLDGNIITCPAHGWQYNVITGECLNEKWAQLKKYEIVVKDNFVFVDISISSS